MGRTAPGTERNLFLLWWKRCARNDRLHRRWLEGPFRRLLDNRFLYSDRLFRDGGCLDDLRLRGRDWRCGLRSVLVNRLRYRLGESRDLAPEFQEFAVQDVILLRGLVGHLFDAEAESALPHEGRDGQDGRG